MAEKRIQVPPSPQSSPSHCNSLTLLQSQTTCRVRVDSPPHLYLPSTQLGADTQSTRVDVCWLTGPSKLAGKSLKRSSIRLSYSLHAIRKDRIHVCLIIRASANTFLYIILNMKYFICTKTSEKQAVLSHQYLALLEPVHEAHTSVITA